MMTPSLFSDQLLPVTENVFIFHVPTRSCIFLHVLPFLSLPACSASVRHTRISSGLSRRPLLQVFPLSVHPYFLQVRDTRAIISVVQHGQNTLGPLMVLTHQVQCLCSILLNRQPISGSKLDLLSFLNFPQGRMILLSNKHNCCSPSSQRRDKC